MSHPISGESYEKEPDATFGHGKVKKHKKKSGGPLHNVANRMNAKARALKKMLNEK